MVGVLHHLKQHTFSLEVKSYFTHNGHLSYLVTFDMLVPELFIYFSTFRLLTKIFVTRL